MSPLLFDTQGLARPRPYAQRHFALCARRDEASNITMHISRISLERGLCAHRSQLTRIDQFVTSGLPAHPC